MKKKKQNDEAPLPAREAALRILERTGISAPVQSLLDTKLTGGLFSRQEAALTTELVYGHLRSGNPDFVASEPIYEGSGKAARVHETHDRHSRLRAAVP